MAYSKDNLDIVGGQRIAYEGVRGNTDHHTAVRNRAGGESKIDMSHPTLKPNTNYKQRGRSGTDVPKPGELNLP